MIKLSVRRGPVFSTAYTQVHFRLRLIIEPNTVKPDQTTSNEIFCFEAILFAIGASKVNKQISQQSDIVVNGGKSVTGRYKAMFLMIFLLFVFVFVLL